MATVTFDKDSVASHGTLDGNTTTEVSGSVVQKKEFSDELQDTLGAQWTRGGIAFGYDNDGNFTEHDGYWDINNVVGSSGAHDDAAYVNIATFLDGTFEIDIDNFAGIDRYAVGIWLYVDDNNWFRFRRIKYDGTNGITCNVRLAGVDTPTLSYNYSGASCTIKFTRSNSGADWEAWYDVGAGFVSLGTITGKNIGSATLKVGGTAYNTKTLTSADINYCRISGTGVYWNNDPVVTYNADTSEVGGTIDFSNTTGTFDATTLIDISVDGGSTWYATDKTLAQVQALSDTTIGAGGLTIRTTHGNTTSQSDFTSIAFDVTPAATNNLGAYEQNAFNTPYESGAWR